MPFYDQRHPVQPYLDDETVDPGLTGSDADTATIVINRLDPGRLVSPGSLGDDFTSVPDRIPTLVLDGDLVLPLHIYTGPPQHALDWKADVYKKYLGASYGALGTVHGVVLAFPNPSDNTHLRLQYRLWEPRIGFRVDPGPRCIVTNWVQFNRQGRAVSKASENEQVPDHLSNNSPGLTRGAWGFWTFSSDTSETTLQAEGQPQDTDPDSQSNDESDHPPISLTGLWFLGAASPSDPWVQRRCLDYLLSQPSHTRKSPVAVMLIGQRPPGPVAFAKADRPIQTFLFSTDPVPAAFLLRGGDLTVQQMMALVSTDVTPRKNRRITDSWFLDQTESVHELVDAAFIRSCRSLNLDLSDCTDLAQLTINTPMMPADPVEDGSIEFDSPDATEASPSSPQFSLDPIASPNPAPLCDGQVVPASQSTNSAPLTASECQTIIQQQQTIIELLQKQLALLSGRSPMDSNSPDKKPDYRPPYSTGTSIPADRLRVTNSAEGSAIPVPESGPATTTPTRSVTRKYFRLDEQESAVLPERNLYLTTSPEYQPYAPSNGSHPDPLQRRNPSMGTAQSSNLGPDSRDTRSRNYIMEAYEETEYITHHPGYLPNDAVPYPMAAAQPPPLVSTRPPRPTEMRGMSQHPYGLGPTTQTIYRRQSVYYRPTAATAAQPERDPVEQLMFKVNDALSFSQNDPVVPITGYQASSDQARSSAKSPPESLRPLVRRNSQGPVAVPSLRSLGSQRVTSWASQGGLNPATSSRVRSPPAVTSPQLNELTPMTKKHWGQIRGHT
ncbi:hypothetical protein H4R33_003010 [Dimargaris cristalligena]|nr:hypothetical protein H4R33_003010 [Dimargaris cristalligena]